MGGFLQNLGSALSGAGAATDEYNNRLMRQWEVHQRNGIDAVDSALKVAQDEGRRAELYKLRTQIQKLRPGQDPSKLLQGLSEHTSIHPSSIKMMEPPAPPKPTPGAQAPGSAPGTNNPLLKMIGTPSAPPGAQPSQSLVQQPAGDISIPPNLPAAPGSAGTGGGPLTPSLLPAQAPQVQAQAQPPPPPLLSMSQADLQRQFFPMNGLGELTEMTMQMGRPGYEQAVQMQAKMQLAQMEQQRKQAALQAMEASPEWSKLPEHVRMAYRAEAAGINAPNMPASMLTHRNLPGTIPSSSIPVEELLDLSGNPIDARKTPTVRAHMDPLTQRVYYSPATTPSVGVATENGLEFVPRVPGKVTASGGGAALPPSALTPRVTGVDPSTGGNVFNDVFGIKAGKPTGVAPSMLPVTTVNHVPGELPRVSTSQRGNPSKSAGGGTGPRSLAASDPLIKREYDDWVAGNGPAPTGGKLAAVQSYAAANGLPSPVQLTPVGQSALASINTTQTEISRAIAKLKELKPSRNDLFKAWVRYSTGQQDAGDERERMYTQLISDVSFASLQSSATALKGTGSRAYPILKKALEHTPIEIVRNGPEAMLTKLQEMGTRSEEARKFILEDFRKSGVVPNGGVDMSLSPSPSPSPSSQSSEALKRLQKRYGIGAR